jgi:transcriptional regulator with XRE-family HTH domain
LSGHTHESDELARLGSAIRQLREQRRMSQVQLAAVVGVPDRRLAALELGQLDPDYVLLVRLAKALGVRAAALLLRAEELAGDSDDR